MQTENNRIKNKNMEIVKEAPMGQQRSEKIAS